MPLYFLTILLHFIIFLHLICRHFFNKYSITSLSSILLYTLSNYTKINELNTSISTFSLAIRKDRKTVTSDVYKSEGWRGLPLLSCKCRQQWGLPPHGHVGGGVTLEATSCRIDGSWMGISESYKIMMCHKIDQRLGWSRPDLGDVKERKSRNGCWGPMLPIVLFLRFGNEEPEGRKMYSIFVLPTRQGSWGY